MTMMIEANRPQSLRELTSEDLASVAGGNWNNVNRDKIIGAGATGAIGGGIAGLGGGVAGMGIGAAIGGIASAVYEFAKEMAQ